MEHATASPSQLAAGPKALARQSLTIIGNRIELLTEEAQEAREQLLNAVLLALGVAAFGLLAGFALTVAIVVWLWAWAPVAAALALAFLYGSAALYLARRLRRLRRDWQSFPATLDQLQKDRACLEKLLA